MPTGKPYPKEVIRKIRDEVLKGKSKYQVAKEMGIEHHIIEYHTKDLPSRRRSDPCIQGKSFDLLKQLLSTGVVPSDAETHNVMRTLRRHLPMICYSRFNGKAVFYQELSQMLRIFDIKVDGDEKRAFLGRNRWRRTRKIKESLGRYGSNHKEKQTRIDDFLGRFLHSEVL
jgi:hypothetical protein